MSNVTYALLAGMLFVASKMVLYIRHFTDKHTLLRAIRDEVSLPLIDRSDFTLLSDRTADPLNRVQRFLLDLVRALEEDSRARLAFSVMSFKCEYAGELKGELKVYAR